MYLDLSTERALGGGPLRPARMAPAIATAVMAVVRAYLDHCRGAWDEVGGAG